MYFTYMNFSLRDGSQGVRISEGPLYMDCVSLEVIPSAADYTETGHS